MQCVILVDNKRTDFVVVLLLFWFVTNIGLIRFLSASREKEEERKKQVPKIEEGGLVCLPLFLEGRVSESELEFLLTGDFT